MRMAFTAVLVTFLVAGGSSWASTPGERPNVLFIAVDDLNDWVGCLGGHPQARTPNIDRLAARGTLFTNAHCQAPLCNPSRASVMTGLRPSTTGVYALGPWFRTVESLRDLVTLPQHFSAHGYRTLSTGKIYHDGMPPRPQRKPGVEFDVWGYEGSHGPFPEEKRVKTEAKSKLLDWGVFPERDEEMEDWKVADWAIEQIQSPASEGKPFFLCVGFRRPHLPCFAPRRWFDLYPGDDTLVMPLVKEDDRRDVPPFAEYLHWKLPEPRLDWLRAGDQWRPLVRSYLASVSFVDSQIGRVLDALEASGQADRTVVVLWSDHGWHLGEKGMTGKTTLWERSTQVPLIFAGPGITPGGKCGQPAELLDLYPTLVELCGIAPKPGLEGHSLVPQLKDAAAPREWPAITTHGPNNHSVRTAAHRYTRYADGSEELYDLTTDPNEWINLVPGSTTPVKAGFVRWLPKVNAPPVRGKGSETRLIELRDGKPLWEGAPIDDTATSRPAPDEEAAERAEGIRGCRGTYAGAPRRQDGRVDAPRLLEELEDLGADTYNWLVWHAATDWDDLKAFLPLARARGIRVWVTLVPPSESPPHAKTFSEPFRLDYERWAEEIARLSLAEPNLVAWSIDDFTHNLRVFTPEHTRAVVRRARRINPRLAFVPCAYFKSITPRFAAAYRDTLDGVLFPYRNESRGANLTDADAVTDEVGRLRELFGPNVRVVVDVYSSRHSTLGTSTPAYVRQVLADASKAADGVIVYCHPRGKGEREKYEAVRDVFRAVREGRGKDD